MFLELHAPNLCSPAPVPLFPITRRYPAWSTATAKNPQSNKAVKFGNEPLLSFAIVSVVRELLESSGWSDLTLHRYGCSRNWSAAWGQACARRVTIAHNKTSICAG